MSTIAANLATVRARIAATCTRSGRKNIPRLIAVSKKQPEDAVEAALIAGHRLFGENYVQEAIAKFTPLRSRYQDIELHLIGPLQTNKVEQAVAFFDAIQTLDREKLAAELAKAIQKTGKRPDLYVEVNVGAEEQKAGVYISETPAFVQMCKDRYGLRLSGLMCVPPVGINAAPSFAALKRMAHDLGLARLSMGMSSDYVAAILEGSTEVRVGTAIFGARPFL